MSGPTPRWRTRLQLPPSARLAVGADSVLATCYGPARTDRLASFALADGEPRWQVALDDFILADALSPVELIADPEGDAVYLAQGTMVACFAVATGAQRWAVQVPTTPPFESFTIAGPPAIVGALLLLRSRRSRLVALDRKSGGLRFATADHEPALRLVVMAGVAITRSLDAADVRAHDLATGAPLWTRPTRGDAEGDPGLRMARARDTDDAGPYLVNEDGVVVALEPRTGVVRWRVSVPGAVRAAQVGGAVVLAHDDGVRAVEAGTGTARWSQPERGSAVIAPLDGATVVAVRASATSLITIATGQVRDYPGRRVAGHDRVLDARTGAAALTTDGGVARLYALTVDGLRELLLGEDAARPGEPAAHDVLQAAVTADGAVTLATDGALARFVK